ncbi:MAG: hypothetical protein RBS39_00600 [Phycisphaerales bacterium]|jgi:hypothetical protein|nr:hypothetical protein [Phycisphaerales bacterium]
MSHKPERTLDALFAHPIPMNIHWNDVTHLLTHLGAEVEVVQGGREKVRLNGQERTFHIPHSRVLDSKDEVVALRHFLESCGVKH